MPVLFFLLIAALVGVGAYLAWYFKQKRIKELALQAKQLGFQFSTTDPFNTLGEPFSLFRKGDGRGVENVMWGQWQSMDIHQFDYWYYEESTDSQGHRSKTYYRFNCVMCPVEAACPELSIDHESLFSRIADHLSFHDIEFESEEFNKKYQIKGSDKKFANDFIDQRMIQYLLQHGEGFSFEIVGDRILCSHKRVQPTELVPLLGTLKGFHDQIPGVVYELYAKNPPRPDVAG
jgi:hypothetical protein